MTDLEQEIRERLHADAEGFQGRRLPGPRVISPLVKRRVKKRQVWTVVVALTTASLVAVGAVLLVPALPRNSESRPAGTLAGSNIVEIPLPGETEAVFLEDGTPAFVVAHEDGTASVFEAFSTHVPYGLTKLVWWCPTSRWFEDPFHGSKYDELGNWQEGPASSGLANYREVVLGGGRLRVRTDSTYVAPIQLGPGRVAIHPEGIKPAGPFCTSAEAALVHEFAEEDLIPVDELSDSPDGWTAVRATLTLEIDEPPRLCSSDDERTCFALSTPFFEDQELLDTSLRPRLELPGPVWMVRVLQGEVMDLARAIPPDYEESGT